MGVNGGEGEVTSSARPEPWVFVWAAIVAEHICSPGDYSMRNRMGWDCVVQYKDVHDQRGFAITSGGEWWSWRMGGHFFVCSGRSVVRNFWAYLLISQNIGPLFLPPLALTDFLYFAIHGGYKMALWLQLSRRCTLMGLRIFLGLLSIVLVEMPVSDSSFSFSLFIFWSWLQELFLESEYQVFVGSEFSRYLPLVWCLNLAPSLHHPPTNFYSIFGRM